MTDNQTLNMAGTTPESLNMYVWRLNRMEAEKRRHDVDRQILRQIAQPAH